MREYASIHRKPGRIPSGPDVGGQRPPLQGRISTVRDRRYSLDFGGQSRRGRAAASSPFRGKMEQANLAWDSGRRRRGAGIRTLSPSPRGAGDKSLRGAQFWDKHDVADFESQLEEAVFVEGPKGRLMALQLDDLEAATVCAAAKARGIDEATMIREWIRDHAPKAAS
jgi:hypothetical protein